MSGRISGVHLCLILEHFLQIRERHIISYYSRCCSVNICLPGSSLQDFGVMKTSIKMLTLHNSLQSRSKIDRKERSQNVYNNE